MSTVLQPDRTITCNGVKVNQYLLTLHNPFHIDMPTAQMNKVIGVTIHNTDWISVIQGSTPAEQYTRATVNGNMNDVRVHYYVDDKCAWQNLPLNSAGWHAADGKGDGNRKTIAIECIMSPNYNGIDQASELNAARLAAYLLHEYNLDINHLYTHTHWLNVKDGKRGDVDFLNTDHNNYKDCPFYILPHWNDFKEKVQDYLNELNNGNEIDHSDELVYLKKGTPIFPNAGANTRMSGVIKTSCKYTIVEKRSAYGVNWGRLKSNKGWVKLK